MPNNKITPSLFPEQLRLDVNPDVLPRQFRYQVQPVAGFVPSGPIVLHFNLDGWFVKLSEAELPDPRGFSRALTLLLRRAGEAGLWGDKISVIAIAMNETGNVRIARSNEVMLPTPAAPLLVTDSVLLMPGSGELPKPLLQPVGQGRRLYRRAQMSGGPNDIPMLWYVDPGGRLEESTSARGFDPFTFWLGYFNFPVRDSMFVTTGEALSIKLGGRMPREIPPSGTLAQIGPAIISAMGRYPHGGDLPGLMWSGQRVVTVGKFSMQTNSTSVHEFGLAGMTSRNIQTWLAEELQSNQWNYRSLHDRIRPLRAFGIPSL